MKIVIFSLLLFINTLFAAEKLEITRLEKVSLQLHWKYQFEFAGFIAAKEKGFYKDVGLDVDLREYRNGLDIVESVVDEKATYGIYNSNILISYLKKKPVKLIASFFKRPALIIITQPNIKTPQDLVGKKIMAHTKDDFNFNFKYMLDKENVDINSMKFIKHTYRVDEFAKGEVDAITAFVSDEPYKLDKKGIKYNIITPVDYGLYNLQLELFTSELESLKHPRRVEAFKKASIKGWEYALNHKDEMIDIIYSRYSKNVSKDSLKNEAKIIERLILPNIYKVGLIDKNFLNRQFEIFTKELKVKNNVNLDDFIFNINNYKNQDLKFSQNEIKYLKTKKEITACIDPDWMPFEAFKDGKHIGLSSDYLKIFSKQLNLPIRVVKTDSWTQTLEFAKKRGCDIVPLITKNSEREKFLNFTTPLIKTPIVIATKLDSPFVIDFKSIKNKKIGIPKNYAIAKKLKKKYAYLDIVDIKNIEDGMEQVKKGKIYGVIGSLGVVGYMVQRKYLGQLKISGKFDEFLSVPMGIRNDKPLLVDIFQKLVDNLTETQHNNIFDKWVSSPLEKEFNYVLFYQIIFIFISILLIILFFYKKQTKLKDSLETLVDQKTLKLKQQNERLQHSVKNFQDLLDATLEVIIISDESQNIIEINKAGTKLFGVKSKKEMIGMSILTLLPEPEKLKVIEALHHTTQQPFEVTIKTYQGKIIPILASGKDTIRDGRKIRISSIIDITELKRKDEQLLQQAKLAQMGEMVSMIAHQWRQPLNLLSLINQTVIYKYEAKKLDDTVIKNFKEKSSSVIQQMSSTIDDFRNFFKPEKEKILFCINDVIDHVHDITAPIYAQKNIIIKHEIEKVYSTFGYPNELGQCILNIVNNAQDALVDCDKEEKKIIITLQKEKSDILLSIIDNAGGIPLDIMHKVFDPYFSTKLDKNGTGLGLYISKIIIDEHMQGKLSVSNTKDGACFQIQLKDHKKASNI